MPLAKPTGIGTQTLTATSVKVVWDAVVGATSYTVVRSQAQTEIDTTVVTNPEITFTGLAVGDLYKLSITATDGVETSEPALAITYLSVQNYLTAVTDLTHTPVSDTAFDISWTDSPNATSHRIRIEKLADGTEIFDGTAVSPYSATGLDPLTGYKVTVWPVEGALQGAEARLIAITFPAVDPSAVRRTSHLAFPSHVQGSIFRPQLVCGVENWDASAPYDGKVTNDLHNTHHVDVKGTAIYGVTGSNAYIHHLDPAFSSTVNLSVAGTGPVTDLNAQISAFGRHHAFATRKDTSSFVIMGISGGWFYASEWSDLSTKIASSPTLNVGAMSTPVGNTCGLWSADGSTLIFYTTVFAALQVVKFVTPTPYDITALSFAGKTTHFIGGDFGWQNAQSICLDDTGKIGLYFEYITNLWHSFALTEPFDPTTAVNLNKSELSKSHGVSNNYAGSKNLIKDSQGRLITYEYLSHSGYGFTHYVWNCAPDWGL